VGGRGPAQWEESCRRGQLVLVLVLSLSGSGRESTMAFGTEGQ
jgi:hypothetical protein